jgi:hypothetical protein
MARKLFGALAGAISAMLLSAAPTSADILYFPTYVHDYRHFQVTVSDVAPRNAIGLPDRTTTSAPLGPGLWIVVNVDYALFRDGKPIRIKEIEPLVEDANPVPLYERLSRSSFIHAIGFFEPGHPFDFYARPGEKLIFLTMFLQSNDLFYAPAKSGLVLFDFDENPRTGDVTDRVRLWDAGTEVNERPGGGMFQAVRQGSRNLGTNERGVVRPVRDGFGYPAADKVIRVEVEASDTRYRRTDTDRDDVGMFAPIGGM